MDHQDTARAVGNTALSIASAAATFAVPEWMQIVPIILSMMTASLGIVWWSIKIYNEIQKRKESDNE
jgi:hypothetical protein